MAGRKPFKHVDRDADVIQKVLSGIRPDRPAMGFSDALWALLDQTWLEVSESSDSQPVRPNIANIIKQLQGEIETWSPADMVLSPTTQAGREESCVYSVPSDAVVRDILKDIDDPNPADDPPEAPPIIELILSEWQRLVSMDGQSPDFLSLLSTLTVGVNRSSIIKLQDENARIVLGALDEVGRPLTVAQ